MKTSAVPSSSRSCPSLTFEQGLHCGYFSTIYCLFLTENVINHYLKSQ